jgi:hypothetical protein
MAEQHLHASVAEAPRDGWVLWLSPEALDLITRLLKLATGEYLLRDLDTAINRFLATEILDQIE